MFARYLCIGGLIILSSARARSHKFRSRYTRAQENYKYIRRINIRRFIRLGEMLKGALRSPDCGRIERWVSCWKENTYSVSCGHLGWGHRNGSRVIPGYVRRIYLVARTHARSRVCILIIDASHATVSFIKWKSDETIVPLVLRGLICAMINDISTRLN